MKQILSVLLLIVVMVVVFNTEINSASGVKNAITTKAKNITTAVNGVSVN